MMKAPDYPKSLVAEFLGLLAADRQLLAKKCATLPAPHNPSKRVVATAGRAMKVIIIAAVFVLTFATDMTADETTIGRWCDRMVPNMPKHNQTMAIVITDGGKVMLKSSFGDRSSGDIYEKIGSRHGDKYRIVSSTGKMPSLNNAGSVRERRRVALTPSEDA